MSKLLNKIATTYRNHGLGVVIKKIRIRIRYLYLRKRYFTRAEAERWKELKDKYKGKRVFLLGNGPSLNKTPLFYLKDEYTMCFNRFYIMEERLNWTPNFYMTVDNLVLDDLVKEVGKIIDTSEYAFFPAIHFRGQKFITQIPKMPKIYWVSQYFGKDFSLNLPRIYQGGSVIYEGFQVLQHLGFDAIYVIGVDMSFKTHKTAESISKGNTDIISKDDDDPNHFDPRYFGKNRKYHQPEDFVIQNIMNSLDFLGANLEHYQVNIINAGYDSKVESFPRVDFESLFNFSDEEKQNLFSEMIADKSDFDTVSAFIAASEKLSEKQEWKKTGHFYTDMYFGTKIIKETIFTHIPLGPYNNYYYFIKR
ncbi:hypothetical protein Clim_1896 [Chlorobium limicola DSM 245]|uniref:6-hydroxymethylpterin diphosphokinase MptE-like domain-containing protein n=1 Tax=Chlorobium limicola (strain DSM 245 / NBRC 103803 / 6330) TaxID=290315 RepID=B3EF67_CHLL2|nr:hypothetical protein Clim_1896 [Chlorobium limicola DSM 245]